MVLRRPLRRRGAACCAALLLLIAAAVGAAAPARAQQDTPGSAAKIPTTLPTVAPDPNALVPVTRLDKPPPGRRMAAGDVARIAERTPQMRTQRRAHPGAKRDVYTKGTDRWQVSLFAKVPAGQPRREVAQIQIFDRDGRVLEAWTGYQVAWTMARGYAGAFGRKVNSPWVWIPLAIAFVVPFVDPRRPRRMLHLDLLVLSAFSVSLAFFNDAQIGRSVPLVYPLLAYLLLRMLWVGLRRSDAERLAREPLRLLVPVSWLAIAVVFLLGFRVALNVTSSNVIDVGYAGVIGADRFADGHGLYGKFPEDNQHGDTYGPVTYAAYEPFEQAMPWSGRWDELPAAHGAAIAFDVLATLLCFLLGRRARGPGLGVALAFAWVAFPFTLYTSMTNANDGLVAVLVLAALWAASGGVGGDGIRGGLVALAGLTKFAPLALAPLFALHRPLRDDGTRRGRILTVLAFGFGFTVFALLAFVPVFAHNSPRSFWSATIAFQADRGSPFSIWGLYDNGWLDALQTLVQVGAVLLALGVALVPRRRDLVGLAALSAAVLVALQLGVTHWFYLYIPWFFPLVMLALLGRHGEPGPEPA